jgi:membrane carboxypeptidase/penicillin-binding protein
VRRRVHCLAANASVDDPGRLAALPKGPNNYHPFRHRQEAIARRDYVIERMLEDRYITPQQAEVAKKDPFKVTQRPTGARIFAAEYFAEEVRRYVNDNYGEKKLYDQSARIGFQPGRDPGGGIARERETGDMRGSRAANPRRPAA